MANLVLPKLRTDTNVRPPERQGIWTNLESKSAFQNVATSLDYQASGEIKSVSSVPTMWARPLSIEMALHNKNYPIRREMVAQWQGMLTAIALAEVRRFPITAQLIDLGKLRQHSSFSRALHELLPNPVNALYSLDGGNPWQEVYVFSWNNKPVGMTSPSTIVATSEEGDWTGLPWWNQETRCLESPLSGNYLNENEKALLWRWLENLGGQLHNYKGQPRAIDEISGLINEFRNSLGSYPDQALNLTNNPQYFGVPLNRGVLNGINYPVKPEAQPSNVRLIPSRGMAKVADLLVLDPNLAEAWGKSPQNIWIHQDQTLASLRLEDLKSGKTIWQNVRWIESKDFFLPELTFIDIEDALPGAFLPEETQPLIFNKRRITTLLPLNPILLEYFTPEDLISRINVTPLNSSDGSFVRIELDLPLSGINNQAQNYRVYRDYLLKEENALADGVPILEVWPNFQADNWQEYYGFYYDAGLGEDTFGVSFPQAKDPHVFQQGRGNYQLTRLDRYPSHILCQSQDRQAYGLILLKTPPKIDLTGNWRVGVDFGTSFTNIYVNRKGTSEPLSLETLHHKITEADNETRIPVLFEYFIPENFLPLEKPLPLSSVLTTRGKTHCPEGKEKALLDGRIFNIDARSFKSNADWIETDLKWDNHVPNKLFLEHLALHISAIAVSKGIREIQWSLSYPSAFSRGDRRRYSRTWQEITDKFNKTTGIKHLCPGKDDLDYFRTESLAFAQYFADKEEYNLVRSTCIDIGGGTSDISIWEDNESYKKEVKTCEKCSLSEKDINLVDKIDREHPILRICIPTLLKRINRRNEQIKKYQKSDALSRLSYLESKIQISTLERNKNRQQIEELERKFITLETRLNDKNRDNQSLNSTLPKDRNKDTNYEPLISVADIQEYSNNEAGDELQSLNYKNELNTSESFQKTNANNIDEETNNIFPLESDLLDDNSDRENYIFNKHNEIEHQQLQFINDYNFNKQSSEQRAIEVVTETQTSMENRLAGRGETVYLSSNSKGKYWIVEEDNNYYLVPGAKIRINEHNKHTIENLFEFDESNSNYDDFNLIQPAKVLKINLELWQLEKKGRLEFC